MATEKKKGKRGKATSTEELLELDTHTKQIQATPSTEQKTRPTLRGQAGSKTNPRYTRPLNSWGIVLENTAKIRFKLIQRRGPMRRRRMVGVQNNNRMR